jgi:uncharacterized OB-fold protein
MRKSEEFRAGAESAPFWAAAACGKLLVKNCKASGQAHYDPRAHCPFCFSADTEWRETKGEGAIYTLSIMRRGSKAPYAVAYVTLDEGPAVLTNIIDCDLDTLEIGQRVKVRFQAVEDGRHVPMFTPIGG